MAMDGTPLVRFRWRLRGAWMWPTFIVLTVVDGLLIHWRPVAGDHGSLVGGWLIGVFASLIAMILLSPLLSHAIRRIRSDMPKVVSRDYAGTITTVAVTLTILALGLAHHGVTVADAAALQDASARAEAYIGEHAPARFRQDLTHLDAYELEPPRIYRICAAADTSTNGGVSWYCVVVDRDKPFGQSVSFAGHEPNGLLSQGTS